MTDTNNDNETCPPDLPEDGGVSESSPTVHVQVPQGNTLRTDTEGARPTH
ncbi:hypothetical protein BKA00_000226 [Actinomadura coerulea]|uniref:Uncharacterized protein n=1 Tax=Actinomadura coerulea TaxID=46159 RepID=A0A7X0FTB8_9ACTN|nr:hypothetical protein [Actinomadura coerulea]MBB6393312.1 hypothetical protein [Actinomadura coerulea]GGQ37803.1 hypothetical protein GCM10010187_64520 [Actinomadura coerulea]